MIKARIIELRSSKYVSKLNHMIRLDRRVMCIHCWTEDFMISPMELEVDIIFFISIDHQSINEKCELRKEVWPRKQFKSIISQALILWIHDYRRIEKQKQSQIELIHIFFYMK